MPEPGRPGPAGDPARGRLLTPTPGAIAGILGAGTNPSRDAAAARVARALGPAAGSATAPADGILHADGLTVGGVGASAPREVDGVVCALDGDLYNARELAGVLGLDGESAPADVLVAGWRRWESGLLARLRGDFVVLLWERRERRGLIARDQMGGRSLCLTTRGDRVLFGSETRDLLGLLKRAPGPDTVALAHWLALTAPDPQRTLYEGVRRLPPGHWLALPAHGRVPEAYWDPGRGPRERGSRFELVAGLRERLATAVRRRVPPEGPVGLMLSGGLDSASVGALASREPGAERLIAYSAVFPRHKEVDEAALIDRLVNAYGVGSTRIAVESGSVVGGALDYLEQWRLPPVSPNLFFWDPLLRRANADGASVMLDGEGGDELFGFAAYLLADRVRGGRLLSALRLARRGTLGDDPPARVLARVLLRFGLGGAAPYRLHQGLRRRRGPQHYAPAWFRPATARAHFEDDDPWAWKRDVGPRWQAQLRWDVALVGSGLAYEHVRRRAAAAGLSARHPLVDVDVVEYLLRLPPELSFDPHLSRPLLRESVAGLVPDEVRLRPGKSWFNEVFHESLCGPDLPVVRGLLGGTRLELGALLDAERVRQIVNGSPDAFPGGQRSWSLYVWRMTTAELWLRQLQGESPRDVLAQTPTARPSYELEGARAVRR